MFRIYADATGRDFSLLSLLSKFTWYSQIDGNKQGVLVPRAYHMGTRWWRRMGLKHVITSLHGYKNGPQIMKNCFLFAHKWKNYIGNVEEIV